MIKKLALEFLEKQKVFRNYCRCQFVWLSKEFLVFVVLAFAIVAQLGWRPMDHWLSNFSYRAPVAW